MPKVRHNLSTFCKTELKSSFKPSSMWIKKEGTSAFKNSELKKTHFKNTIEAAQVFKNKTKKCWTGQCNCLSLKISAITLHRPF